MAGWLQCSKKKGGEERKLTETKCKGTPWGHHIHQFRKHMEWRATSDTHLSKWDQRNNALWGHPKYIKNMSTLQWMNLTAQLLLHVLVSYHLTTKLAFQTPKTKLLCTNSKTLFFISFFFMWIEKTKLLPNNETDNQLSPLTLNFNFHHWTPIQMITQ